MPVGSSAIGTHGRYRGYCAGTVERATVFTVALVGRTVSDQSYRQRRLARRE